MATTIVNNYHNHYTGVWPSAIPITHTKPIKISDNNNSNSNKSSQPGTTPSLQSIIDQKKYSNGSIRSSVSSNSVPSLVSASSSYESCDSHPLDSFNTWDDIDENFFGNNDDSFDYNFEPLSPIEPQNKTVAKKSSFVSNLSSSLRSFANSTATHNNELVFDIQPRLTDDKLPKTQIVHGNGDTELQTFKITSINSPTSSSPSSTLSSNTLSILKNREPRINSQFLRLYSYESSSRKKGILPEVTHQEEEEFIHRQCTATQSSLDSSRDFALSVRQRLWQCVVLPPREDINSNSPEYVYAGDDSDLKSGDQRAQDDEFVSLIRKKGDVKPWIKLEDEEVSKTKVLRPCGVLNGDIQFTVKGWCNERWLAKTC